MVISISWWMTHYHTDCQSAQSHSIPIHHHQQLAKSVWWRATVAHKNHTGVGVVESICQFFRIFFLSFLHGQLGMGIWDMVLQIASLLSTLTWLARSVFAPRMNFARWWLVTGIFLLCYLIHTERKHPPLGIIIITTDLTPTYDCSIPQSSGFAARNRISIERVSPSPVVHPLL